MILPRILAVITAREGSKGLPGKNIKELCGKPLIAYSIEAAVKCKTITKTVVSTDSEYIASLSRKWGAEAPFLRPPDLSGDDASILKVLDHAIDFYKNKGESFDHILLLQPTSPMRTEQHLNMAIDLYLNSANLGQESLIAVYQAPQKSGWLMLANEEGHISFCFPVNKINPRRQELPQFFYPNGAILMCPIPIASPLPGFYGDKCLPFLMDFDESIDIDTAEDFAQAEVLMAKRLSSAVIQRQGSLSDLQ